MKKFIALALAAFMMVLILAACGGGSENESKTSKESSNGEPVTSESSEGSNESKTSEESSNGEPVTSEGSEESEESEETSEPFEKLLLPDKKWNAELIMLAPNPNYYSEREFWWEESEEDIVVTAIIERTRLMREKYGINLNMIYVDKIGASKAEVEKSISGGLGLDIVADGAMYMAESALNGWYLNLYEINGEVNGGNGYLNFDASWWDQNAIRDLSIGNKLFFLTGDICVTDDESTWAMFFNKEIIADLWLPNPYTLVESGEWTLDMLHQMAKQAALKHGAKMSFDPAVEDRWGMVAQANDGLMFMLGCGQTMVNKNAEDFPVIRIAEEANINAWSRIFTIITDGNHVGVADFFGASNSGVYAQETQIFANGNALFMPQAINTATGSSLLEAEVDYGIIPMPKIDLNQNDYTAPGTVYCLKAVGVPITNNENLDATLFFLEAMAYHGQKIITPAYYEKVLKGQKSKDEESERMLDLIFKNKTYDMSAVYNFGVGNDVMIQFYSLLLDQRPENKITSFYEQKQSIYNTAIENAIEAFLNN
ncbi:MAG: hypothetical protein WCR95_04385 [Eubacteriales bacterium]